MQVLNEYIQYVPLTNLWLLWAVAVIPSVLLAAALCKKWEGSSIVLSFITLFYIWAAVMITFSPTPHLEQTGYINDPSAFVEMLDEWEVVDQQNQLITMRRMEPMTEDEVKEWKEK